MLRPTSPPKCVLEAGDFFFYYSIERNVIYLTLAERSYPRRLVFEYLRELSNAFGDEFGSMVDTMNRPYAAVAFDHRMEKIRAQFADPQAPSNFQRINSNLMDIHNVMSQNIQDIIQRGEKLERELSQCCHVAHCHVAHCHVHSQLPIISRQSSFLLSYNQCARSWSAHCYHHPFPLRF